MLILLVLLEPDQFVVLCYLFRDSYFEYMPGNKDLPPRGKDREPDVAKDESTVIPEVDLKVNQKVDEDKDFGAQ